VLLPPGAVVLDWVLGLLGLVFGESGLPPGGVGVDGVLRPGLVELG